MSKHTTSVSMKPPLRKKLDKIAADKTVTLGSLVRLGAALVATADAKLLDEIVLACGGAAPKARMGPHVSAALSLSNEAG